NGKHRVRLDRDAGWIASAECRLIEHGVLARHHRRDGRYAAMRDAAAQRLIEARRTTSGFSSKHARHTSTGRRSESGGGELSPGDDMHRESPLRAQYGRGTARGHAGSRGAHAAAACTGAAVFTRAVEFTRAAVYERVAVCSC